MKSEFPEYMEPSVHQEQTNQQRGCKNNIILLFHYHGYFVLCHIVVMLGELFLISCEMFNLYLSHVALWEGKGPRNPGWAVNKQ